MNNANSNYLNVLGQINLDNLHIQQTFDYYQQRYTQSELAKCFVQSSCRITDEHRRNLNIGFCDRTLGTNVPKRKSVEGAAIRGSLQRCGLIRATGHELFRGCIVFPAYDDCGNVGSAVGYRIGRIREGDKPVVLWHRPDPKFFVDVGMTFAKEIIREKAYH
ncbi:hypothetical protein [Paraglaciecola sp.]|uniref:hypothetical protein n=1 Tax=Paraglaciecola sp. TaxID=1920173 RepID=UPI00273F0B0D|nr:hypothetical protein [Paraglaciecola sp.]MDP5033299.1 hypothetical protein [Paraglaciecola sp.]